MTMGNNLKILAVEDDKWLIAFLKKGLSAKGFIVDISENGIDALNKTKAASYDIILLDIMLPGMDGREIIKKLRESGDTTPVIFLSALTKVEDRVAGLNLGADDYIVKPFDLEELLVRIDTVLRRMQNSSDDNLLSCGDLELDQLSRTVKRNGVQIHLSPSEYKLLNCLMKNRKKVLSRETIAENLFGHASMTDTNSVDVSIFRLREKIDASYKNKLIHAVKRVGYILEDRK